MPQRDADTLYTAFGAAVREARIAKGLSQEGLAKLIQVPRTYVVDVEQGRRNLTIRNIHRFATALGLSLGALMARVDTRMVDR